MAVAYRETTQWSDPGCYNNVYIFRSPPKGSIGVLLGVLQNNETSVKKFVKPIEISLAGRTFSPLADEQQ